MVERYEFDKIWARRENDATSGMWSVHVLSLATEYVRADIHESLAARVAVLEAALKDARSHFNVEYGDGRIQSIGHDSGALRKVIAILDAALPPKQPTPATQVDAEP